MEISLRIEGMKDSLTEAEKKISKYILENSTVVYNHSIKELANLIDTSTSSIVRFCKKLGYEKFQDFKISLAMEHSNYNNKEKIIYEDVSLDDGIDEIINKISVINIKSIESIKSLINKRELIKAVDLLNKANCIYLYGVGASGLVAMDFQYKLIRIGKKAIMFLDSHSQLASSVNIGKNDVAVGISHSGNTLEVFKSIEKAKSKGATTISITKYGDNPLSQMADIKLFVGDMEGTLRVGAIASRIAQLTVVDILLMALAKNNYNKVSKSLLDSSQMVKDFKVK